MKFAIRDDDTNYFTKPWELEKVYCGVWDKVPVSLAVVPFVGGGRIDVVPPEYWQGGKVFPIGENEELVEFLREQIARRRISLMLHGYSHKDYPNGYEFESSNNDLFIKVREGKKYLEELFGITIKTFVPPHNSLSRRGAQAVIDNGLNILMAYGHWPWERPFEMANFINFAKMAWFWAKYGKSKRYPKPLQFAHHKEFGSYYLGPSTSLSELKGGLDFAVRNNGDFCLATHYYALARDQTLLNKLKELIDYAQSRVESNLKFVSADNLFL